MPVFLVAMLDSSEPSWSADRPGQLRSNRVRAQRYRRIRRRRPRDSRRPGRRTCPASAAGNGPPAPAPPAGRCSAGCWTRRTAAADPRPSGRPGRPRTAWRRRRPAQRARRRNRPAGHRTDEHGDGEEPQQRPNTSAGQSDSLSHGHLLPARPQRDLPRAQRDAHQTHDQHRPVQRGGPARRRIDRLAAPAGVDAGVHAPAHRSRAARPAASPPARSPVRRHPRRR